MTEVGADRPLPMIETAAPALELKALSKRFPGVLALDNASLTVRRGEIHAVIGQNGAGKSTMINVLAGMLAADAGEIVLSGRAVAIQSTAEAIALGIATVYQELSLLPNLTIAENIALGREPFRNGLLDRSAMRTRAKAALAQRETERLFAVLRRLRSEGMAIVYVSHRFREILDLCDRATVLRNGRV